MATFWQLAKYKRPVKFYKNRRPLLNKCPQKIVRLLRNVREVTPRKPNSAKRKVAWVRAKITFGIYRRAFAYLMGEHRKAGAGGIGQYLHIDDLVWIRGGRTQDLPGLKYKIIHGARGFKPEALTYRRKKRSKYVVKRIDKFLSLRHPYKYKFKYY